MPPTLRAPRSPTDTARRFTGWDALVAVVLGLGLAAAGWADLHAYQLSSGRQMQTAGLVGQQGDVRLEDDEFFHNKAMSLHLHNIGGLELDDDKPLRHALGPEFAMEIRAVAPVVQVDFVFANDFPSQDLTVASNGQALEQIHLTPGRIERSYRVPLRPGANQFTITFAVYNGHGIQFENGEQRPVAGTFRRLDVHF